MMLPMPLPRLLAAVVLALLLLALVLLGSEAAAAAAAGAECSAIGLMLVMVGTMPAQEESCKGMVQGQRHGRFISCKRIKYMYGKFKSGLEQS